MLHEYYSYPILDSTNSQLVNLIKRFFLTVFLAHFCLTNFVVCQSDTKVEEEVTKLKMGTFSMEFVQPRGRYERGLGDNAGWGISFCTVKERAIDKPLWLGWELYWNNLFSTSDFYQDVINGFSVSIEDRITTGSLGLNLVSRYFLPLELRPIYFYIDGQVGVRYLYSLNRAFVENSGENIDFSIVEQDFIVSYGASAGCQIGIKNESYFIDLNASINAGTSGSYLGRDDNSANGYAQTNSTTNLLRFKLGLTRIF